MNAWRRIGLSAALVLALALNATSAAIAQSLKVQEKIEVLEERAARDSTDAAAHYNLAMGYFSKNRFDLADKSLQRSIAIEPEFADAWLARSIVHDKDYDFWARRKKGGDDSVRATVREIEGYYRRAFLIDPLVDIRILGSVTWLRPWGDLATGLKMLVDGKYAGAYGHFTSEINNFAKGGNLSAVPSGLLWLRALAAAHNEQYEDASRDLTELVTRTETLSASDSTPDNAPLRANEYRYMLASVRHHQGQADAAIKLYQSVLEHDLGNFMAHVQLGRIYEQARDYPNAVIERRRAVEANPDDASLLTDLGVTLGKAGQFPEAVVVLQQSIDANPLDSRPLYWLGIAHQQLSHPAEAKAAFARFVALAPSRYDRQIVAARERLAQLP